MSALQNDTQVEKKGTTHVCDLLVEQEVGLEELAGEASLLNLDWRSGRALPQAGR